MDLETQVASTEGHAIVPATVPIPEGWFNMGSEAGQDNERPVHRVWVDQFYLAVHQVTNREYARFVSAASHPPPPFWSDPNFHHPDQPVAGVSWLDASSYCLWLSAQSGSTYRLPTEAEWERAARGGMEGALFPWGNQPPQSRPAYTDRWKHGPEIIATSPPNGYGLFDMCENVHEWCADWFAADYYSVSPELNPAGPPTGTRRSSRGGSWRHHIKIARCSARSSIPPEFRYADYGFRVARVDKP